jgi:hypothetical protein
MLSAMRANLSLEHLATIVAVLGTSAVLASCARADSPAVRSDQAPEAVVPNATASAAPPPPVVTAQADEQAQTPGVIATATAAAPSASAHRMHAAPRATTTGQASCGAGTCTADPKKK